MLVFGAEGKADVAADRDVLARVLAGLDGINPRLDVRSRVLIYDVSVYLLLPVLAQELRQAVVQAPLSLLAPPLYGSGLLLLRLVVAALGNCFPLVAEVALGLPVGVSLVFAKRVVSYHYFSDDFGLKDQISAYD